MTMMMKLNVINLQQSYVNLNFINFLTATNKVLLCASDGIETTEKAINKVHLLIVKLPLIQNKQL